jgi:protocatechuate 3,4-dioxygenase beta subunit
VVVVLIPPTETLSMIRPMTPRHDRPSTFEGRPLADPSESLFDQGLAFDLETLLSRRALLRVAGLGALSAGLVGIAGCSPTGSGASGSAAEGTPLATAASSSGGSAATADCTVIPEETAGPFPGDGSNGPDVLTQSGVVREDIRSSFGTSTTTAGGVPLTIKLAVVDLANDCKPLAGAAVYVWHCDREGRYSMYSDGVTNENYLRGVQAVDGDGIATFASIFPACYSGRWPHVHFEVYPSLATATDPANRIATSQIALPEATCKEVYATEGYTQSVANLGQVSLSRDNVFGDDAGIHQVGAITGSVASGFTVELPVPVKSA